MQTEAYARESAEKNQPEMNLARRYGVPASEIVAAAYEVWGHSITDEREVRAKTRPRARQHISRELIRNLEAARPEWSRWAVTDSRGD